MKIGTILSSKGRDYFYIMHLSYNGQNREELWNYAKKNRVIGLDSPRIVRDNWLKVRESATKGLGKIWTKQFDIVCSELHTGDIILAIHGWDSLLGVAEISKPTHEYDRNLSKTGVFFDHTREVNWIKAYEYSDRQVLPKPLEGFNNTISKVSSSSPRWSILTNLNISNGNEAKETETDRKLTRSLS